MSDDYDDDRDQYYKDKDKRNAEMVDVWIEVLTFRVLGMPVWKILILSCVGLSVYANFNQ